MKLVAITQFTYDGYPLRWCISRLFHYDSLIDHIYLSWHKFLQSTFGGVRDYKNSKSYFDKQRLIYNSEKIIGATLYQLNKNFKRKRRVKILILNIYI